MRFNKQKRHRRTVRFYTACFGFREPFKVLCDGTLIHHLLANRITPHDKAISSTLGGSVKLFTTRCVIGELKSLGASHAESLKDANNNFNIARCEHEKRINDASCIAEIIGESNSEHFFVGTQDAYMRKKLQQIPGVPVMFGLRNALFLEQPSTSQRDFVNSAEEEKKHGPNPLSRKKKKKPVPTGPNPQKGDKDSEETTKSKSRKRKSVIS